MNVIIFICSTCNSKDADNNGRLLLEKVTDINSDKNIEIIPVECLANCSKYNSVAIKKHGGWLYVFGNLHPDNAKEIVEGAELFLTSENGILPWTGRPQILKSNMVCRLPHSE